jgi:hypothetical protein
VGWKILKPVIATEREEVKTPRVFVSDESAGHRWKAYNESLQMSRKNKTGLSRSVLSQVPKGEAVKCRDMVYILSPDILYTFPMPG